MKMPYQPISKILFGLFLLHGSSAVFAFTIIELDTVAASVSGTTVTGSATLEAQTQPVTSVLNQHIRGIQRGVINPAGGGAGNDDSGFQGVWANSSYTEFENTFVQTPFDGGSHLLMVGFDFMAGGNLLYGVGLGSERGDIDTTFNGGGQELKGTVITPYLGWLLSDNWSIDLTLGSSDIDIKQNRAIGTFEILPGPVVETSVSYINSSLAAERSFAMVNANGFWSIDNWNMGGWLGYLTTKSDQDAYAESDGTEVAGSSVELKQTQIGGDLAYSFGASESYIGVTYVKDSDAEVLQFSSPPQPSDDDDSMLIAAGWRYYGEDGVSAILEWNTRDGRDDSSEDSISFTLRVDL